MKTQHKVRVEKMEKLRLAERNIRSHPETQLKEFMKSVEQFGQLRPVVVDENFEILAGNGLYMAMSKLGYTEAEVLQFENLTGSQKKKLMIADNKVYEEGGTRKDVLGEFLQELADEQDFEIVGFDQEVLRSLYGTKEDIDNAVSEYGKMSDEEVEETREEGLKSHAKEDPVEESEDDYVVLDPDKVRVEEDSKPYVVCTKCGERIWLS